MVFIHPPAPPRDYLIDLQTPVFREIERDFLKNNKPPPNSIKKKPPPQQRKTSTEFFKAALAKHHKYDPSGSALNYKPATARQIETLCENWISDSTANRLFHKIFGSVRAYKQDCANGIICQKLKMIMGDMLNTIDPKTLEKVLSKLTKSEKDDD